MMMLLKCVSASFGVKCLFTHYRGKNWKIRCDLGTNNSNDNIDKSNNNINTNINIKINNYVKKFPRKSVFYFVRHRLKTDGKQ